MLSFALALLLMLSITSIAFAAGGEGSDNAPQFDPIFELIENIAKCRKTTRLPQFLTGQ